MTFEQFMHIVQIVLVPGLGGLLWLVWRAMDKAERAEKKAEQARASCARDLDAFKLEVAKEYASKEYIKEVEQRLLNYLERIDNKLDGRPATLAAG